MENPKLSEIIFALDQIKELHKDKEVSQLTLNETEVFVEFRDYKSYTIEIKSNQLIGYSNEDEWSEQEEYKADIE